MAVVSRICTITFDNGLGSSRTWVATAATQDTANGSSVVVTITQATTGGIPPAVTDTWTLRYVNDAGSVIKSVTLNNSSSSQTDTFHFTDTGNSGGSSRHGTVEIRMQVTKTTGGPTNTYDYESDGSPSTPPTTFTATQVDRGWIRGTTTATHSISNISAGGSKSSPASFPDPLHVRVTTGSTAYNSVTYVAGLKEGATTKRTASTNSTTQNWDVAFTSTSTTLGRVNDGLTASSHTLTSFATIPNATLTAAAYTAHTTETTDTIQTDPRRTVTHLFQIDDNTFGTPPMSKNRASGVRLTSEQAFLASRWTNARGEGTNLITWDVLLDPSLPGTDVTNTGVTGTTQGGEVGWSNSFMAWASSLPGGTWTKTVTPTAPSDATSTSHIVSRTQDYVLVASNPSIRVIVNIHNNTSSAGGRHIIGGDEILVESYAIDTTTNTKVEVDPGTVELNCTRHNFTTGYRDFLASDTDNTSACWAPWTSSGALTVYGMTPNATDTRMHQKSFMATTGWGTSDIAFNVSMDISGSTYTGNETRELVSTYFKHDDSTGTSSPATSGGGPPMNMSPWDGAPHIVRGVRNRLEKEIAGMREDIQKRMAEIRPTEPKDYEPELDALRGKLQEVLLMLAPGPAIEERLAVLSEDIDALMALVAGKH